MSFRLAATGGRLVNTQFVVNNHRPYKHTEFKKNQNYQPYAAGRYFPAQAGPGFFSRICQSTKTLAEKVISRPAQQDNIGQFRQFKTSLNTEFTSVKIKNCLYFNSDVEIQKPKNNALILDLYEFDGCSSYMLSSSDDVSSTTFVDRLWVKDDYANNDLGDVPFENFESEKGKEKVYN